MNKNKIWKTTAIIFISIFCIMMLVVAHKAYRFKTSFADASQFDIELAKNTVQKDIEKTGQKISDYKISVARKSRHISRENTSKRIVSVSLNKDAVTYTYLVDLDAGEILMRSKTEFTGWMKEQDFHHKTIFGKHHG